jgi:hypothetical protein
MTSDEKNVSSRDVGQDIAHLFCVRPYGRKCTVGPGQAAKDGDPVSLLCTHYFLSIFCLSNPNICSILVCLLTLLDLMNRLSYRNPGSGLRYEYSNLFKFGPNLFSHFLLQNTGQNGLKLSHIGFSTS